MKRILAILAILALACPLAACGSKSDNQSEPGSEPASESILEESSDATLAEPSIEGSGDESVILEEPEISEPVSESSEDAVESSTPAENSQTASTPKPESSKPAQKPVSSAPAESSEQAPPPATVLEESSAPASSETSEESAPAEDSGRSAEVFDAINAAFAEAYPDYGCVIPSMPMDMDKQYAADTLGISADLLASAKGQQAGMMTNCDMLLVVEAAEGQFDAVKAAMDAALKARYDAFSWYGVMGNAERTEAAKVVSKGNFIALIMVGIMPEEGTPDFTSDVQLAEDTFYNAIA